MCPGVTAHLLLSKCSHKFSSLILFCVRSAARARSSASKSCAEKRVVSSSRCLVVSSSRPSSGLSSGWPLKPDVQSYITSGAACRTGLRGAAGPFSPEGGTPVCCGCVYADPMCAGRPLWLMYNDHNPTVNMRGFNGLSEEVARPAAAGLDRGPIRTN